jgi:hypothetical protein
MTNKLFGMQIAEAETSEENLPFPTEFELGSDDDSDEEDAYFLPLLLENERTETYVVLPVLLAQVSRLLRTTNITAENLALTPSTIKFLQKLITLWKEKNKLFNFLATRINVEQNSLAVLERMVRQQNPSAEIAISLPENLPIIKLNTLYTDAIAEAEKTLPLANQKILAIATSEGNLSDAELNSLNLNTFSTGIFHKIATLIAHANQAIAECSFYISAIISNKQSLLNVLCLKPGTELEATPMHRSTVPSMPEASVTAPAQARLLALEQEHQRLTAKVVTAKQNLASLQTEIKPLLMQIQNSLPSQFWQTPAAVPGVKPSAYPATGLNNN